MGKAFIVSSCLGSPQPERPAEYAGPARTAIEANDVRFMFCGLPAHIYEDGLSERRILVEFVIVEQVMAAWESLSY